MATRRRRSTRNSPLSKYVRARAMAAARLMLSALVAAGCPPTRRMTTRASLVEIQLGAPPTFTARRLSWSQGPTTVARILHVDRRCGKDSHPRVFYGGPIPVSPGPLREIARVQNPAFERMSGRSDGGRTGRAGQIDQSKPRHG